MHLIRIVNDEDRRAVEWLVTHVGEARVEAAAQRMAHGGNPPFVSAVCRYLGTWPPAVRQSTRTTRDCSVGDEHLVRIRELLAKRGVAALRPADGARRNV